MSSSDYTTLSRRRISQGFSRTEEARAACEIISDAWSQLFVTGKDTFPGSAFANCLNWLTLCTTPIQAKDYAKLKTGRQRPPDIPLVAPVGDRQWTALTSNRSIKFNNKFVKSSQQGHFVLAFNANNMLRKTAYTATVHRHDKVKAIDAMHVTVPLKKKLYPANNLWQNVLIFPWILLYYIQKLKEINRKVALQSQITIEQVIFYVKNKVQAMQLVLITAENILQFVHQDQTVYEATEFMQWFYKCCLCMFKGLNLRFFYLRTRKE